MQHLGRAIGDDLKRSRKVRFCQDQCHWRNASHDSPARAGALRPLAPQNRTSEFPCITGQATRKAHATSVEPVWIAIHFTGLGAVAGPAVLVNGCSLSGRWFLACLRIIEYPWSLAQWGFSMLPQKPPVAVGATACSNVSQLRAWVSTTSPFRMHSCLPFYACA